MLVGERMSRSLITISRQTGVDDALRLMRDSNIRRLPVVDNQGKLVGIVSDKDLYLASPSPASSLDIFELRYLLARLTVDKIMSSPVITVQPDTPLEEAARIMADRKIGGLPVLDTDQNLVGIITESDLFKIFVELLGARSHGVRVTVRVPDVKGQLAMLTSAITVAGGDILSLSTLEGPQPGQFEVMIKVADLGLDHVRTLMEPLKAEIFDIREL
jgi:acetoin utilization protein AcuB